MEPSLIRSPSANQPSIERSGGRQSAQRASQLAHRLRNRSFAGVLTGLLTPALDHGGRGRNEESGEQGRSDPVDGGGRVESSS